MSKMSGNLPFIYDEDFKRIEGIQSPNGDKCLFITSFPTKLDVPSNFRGFVRFDNGQTATYSNGTRSATKNAGLAAIRAHSGNGNITTTASYTFAASIQLPYGYYAVRPIIINGSATGTDLATASISNVASALTPFTPTGTMVAAKLAGSSTFTIPSAVSGAGTSDVIPSITKLDVIDIKSAARTDGGKGSIIMGRVANPAGQIDLRASAYGMSNLQVQIGFAGGENTLNAVAGFSAGTIGPGMVYEIYTDQRTKTIVNIGDSISGGYGYESGMSSTSGPVVAVHTHNNLNNYDEKIALLNYGTSGSTTDAFAANGAIALNTYSSISAAIFAVGSPNDSDRYTDAWLSRVIRLTINFVNDCNARNITPILASMCPLNGASAPQKIIHRDFVATVKNLATSLGCLYAPRFEFYDDGAGNYKTGTSVDGIHPIKAGIDGEAIAVWADILRAI